MLSMLEAAQRLVTSQSPWSGFFFLVVGVILGAFASGYLTVKAQRPRLIVSGGGSGGDQHRQRWTVSIMNRPEFFGVPFAGESARDVHALLRLKERPSSIYPLSWSNHPQHLITIEPGHTESLDVFTWFAANRGSYCVLDASQEPVARFESPSLDFVLRINDRLGRMTELPFKVRFDDSHLKSPPQLSIISPLSCEQRRHMIRNAFRQACSALRPRR